MNQPTASAPSTPPTFRPLPFLAACILPGLGQLVGGEAKRGALVATGILGLFFGGIFIGGVDVIDSREDRAWFFGQALVGPLSFGVDYYHQNHLKVKLGPKGMVRSAYPDEGRATEGMLDEKGTPIPVGSPVVGGTPPNVKSIAKINEIGTLYTTIAGMLNVIAIIDAGLWSRRRSPPGSRPAEPKAAGAAA